MTEKRVSFGRRRPRPPLLLFAAFILACDAGGATDPEPGCEVRNGPVVVTTQAEVDGLAGVCEIAGALEIREAAGTADPITSLAALSDLRTIGTAEGSALRVSWTTELPGLDGLENVTFTDRAELRFEGNAALATLAALGADAEGGVRRLTDVRVWQNGALADLAGIGNIVAPAGAEVTGELSVWANPSLTSLAGLQGVVGPVGLLYVASNPLTSLAGLPTTAAIGSLYLLDLPLTELALELVDVRDLLLIEDNHALTSLRIEAREVGRYLTISENAALESVALTLDRAPEHLVVDQSHQLTSLDLTLAEGGLHAVSLGQAPGLTTLDFDGVLLQGGLALYDTGLADLDAFAPVAALPGPFVLVGNERLADIEAFRAVERVDRLEIVDNPDLCVPAWVAAITVTGGRAATVSGNLCD